MSDADRALATARVRAAARAAAVPDFVVEEDSLPVLVDQYDDPTPVETPSGHPRRRRVTIQTFAEDTKLELRDLRARLNNAGLAAFNMRAELVERLIKLEERFTSVLELGDQVDDLADLARELGEFKVAMCGADGKNGKLGALGVQVGKARTEAAAAPKLIRRVVAWAAGSLLGAIVPCALLINSMVDKASAERAAAAAERATFLARLDASRAEISVLQSGQLLLFRIVNIRSGLDPAGATP